MLRARRIFSAPVAAPVFFAKNGENSRHFTPFSDRSAYTGFGRGECRLVWWTRMVPACVPPRHSHLRLPRSASPVAGERVQEKGPTGAGGADWNDSRKTAP